ncbi:hypothetical protein M011DRAFT_481035 [Sporormia fimetaria CBS 119925]|uniref:Pentatricopeptide repeat protein-like protein n=1 Tax=Sporormia fimetaria CBS 119925 TaxID=1340428 RepID=A0A6A6UY36_9PLEO|nr:hypothetical protein M011DRAFT_481035 [Sporormia fimetaria CBS 119925]
MLSCRACLSRCLRALDASLPADAQPLRSVTAPIHHVSQRRFKSHTAVEVEEEDPAQFANRTAQEAAAEKADKHTQWLKEKARGGLTRPTDLPPAAYRARKSELKYLTDPKELAEFVRKSLEKDRDTEMLQLVRLASRSMQCIVSWNHLIKHTLSMGRVALATKLYNEMKKRAQFPDAYTYSILLRGISDHAQESGNLARALSVYHSMFAENSRVQPSIVHTNSILRVCARAMDMDALWGVAAKIPEKGPASANAITYVTILNAIRQSLLVNVPYGESEIDRAKRIERGVVEARRVWDEIISKWRNAELIIGEELVTAMGRLLLVGARPRDWDDVLSLVEQTMDIPRLVPRLGTEERAKAGFPPLRSPNVPAEFRFDDDHLSPDKTPHRGAEFLPIAPRELGRSLTGRLLYAKPSNDALSMILEACQKVVAEKAADEYWDLLTDPATYNIVPDLNNLNMRLRLLRQNRASAKVVKLLQDYFVGSKDMRPRPGTLRIAMSTCARDKNNHNSLRNANDILDIMLHTTEDADAKTVIRYCDLVLASPHLTGPRLLDALLQLQPVLRSLRLQVGVGAADDRAGAVYLTGEARQDAIRALRAIQGVHDKLINSNMVSDAEKKSVMAAKATLSSFLYRLQFKDNGNMAKWDKLRGAFHKSDSQKRDRKEGYGREKALLDE